MFKIILTGVFPSQLKQYVYIILGGGQCVMVTKSKNVK